MKKCEMIYLIIIISDALFWKREVDLNILDKKGDNNVTIKINGNAWSLGQQYFRFFIGNPPQAQTFILDSGSEWLASPCGGCPNCCKTGQCGKHQQPWQDISKSRSIKGKPCAGDCSCQSLGNGQSYCEFDVFQSEGSSLAGFRTREILSLSAEAVQKAEVDFYCTTKETNLFQTQAANGIAGINGNRGNSWMSQFLLADNTINGLNFSVCLGNEGGYMNIGNPNVKFWNQNQLQLQAKLKMNKDEDSIAEQQQLDVKTNSDAQVAFDPHGYFVEVKVESLSVSNRSTFFGADEKALVDTGNTFTMIPSGQLSQIQQDINDYLHTFKDFDESMVKIQQGDQGQELRVFQDKSKFDSVLEQFKMFPDIDLDFANGTKVSIFPYHYLVKVPGIQDTYRMGTLPGRFILGMTFLRGLDVQFDQANSMLHFNNSTCEEDEYIFKTKLKDFNINTITQDKVIDSHMVDCVLNQNKLLDQCQKNYIQQIKDKNYPINGGNERQYQYYWIILILLLFVVISIFLYYKMMKSTEQISDNPELRNYQDQINMEMRNME